MEILFNSVHLLWICLLFTLSPVYGEDKCVKRNSCSCVFPNGTGIDLSPSAKNSVYTSTGVYEVKSSTQVDLSTYFYHPCFDVLMKINETVPAEGNTCNQTAALCRHRSIWNSTEKDKLIKNLELYELLGSSNDTDKVLFAPDARYIQYKNVPSSSFMYLVCAEADDQFYVKSLTDPDGIHLAFVSRNACLRQIESSRSVGSTLLIIFFSFVIFYLILGVCTKKFLMGATGIEVIPNLMFWTELPNLVKDGWAFALNGFKLPARGPGPTTSPDPNSYDSI